MKFLEEPYNKAQTLDFLTNAGMSEPPLVYAVDKDDDFIGYVIFHDYDDLSYEIGWVGLGNDKLVVIAQTNLS